MARTSQNNEPKDNEPKDKKKAPPTPMEQMAAYLEENKKFFYNDLEEPTYVISSGSLKLDIQMGGGLRPGVIRLTGVTEGGKSLIATANVLTKDGWKLIKNIKIGDKVFGSDGKTHAVLGVYHQGKLPVYKVSFSDQTYTYCSLDHLWSVRSYIDRSKHQSPQVLSTQTILQNIRANIKDRRLNYSIDYCQPICFERKQLPIHPYLLGALLGDGSLTSNGIRFTSNDKQIIQMVRRYLSILGAELVYINRYDYRIRKKTSYSGQSISKLLKSLNLLDTISNTKFIPPHYLMSSIEDRVALLQGLMDTDGTVESKGKGCRASFSSCSENLIKNVADVVRSLGGMATLDERIGWYYKNNKRVLGQKSYRLTISFSNGINPFLLSRKANKFRTKTHKKYKYISKIEYYKNDDCVCIKVNSPDSLYITEDYILTHNTNCALSFARNFLSTVENSYVIYFRAEGRLTDEILNRQGILNHPRLQIVKGNVYEKVIGFIANQVKNNPHKARYLFVVDSADAMIPVGDLDKKPEEANKVSGGALLTSDMLRRMANMFIAFGHICIIISQKRDQVTISQYAKSDPRITNASGGNALLHYSDWILEFQHRYFSDLILSNPEEKDSMVGHLCKIIFRKSPNEKSFTKVDYPIRYGRENGKSIWVEREIFDILVAFAMLVKTAEKSAWLTLVEPERVLLKEAGLEFPEKIQGESVTIEFLEQNPKITDHLYKRLCANLHK